jgi:transmembrane sensor
MNEGQTPRTAGSSAERELRAEAAVWLARLHGPGRCASLDADFRAWLQADSAHAHAFEDISNIWDAIGQVDAGGLPRLAPRRTAFADSDGPADGGILTPARILRPAFGWAAIAAISMIALALAWTALRTDEYVTAVGEQRIVKLEDGSRLSLNSNTRLEVRLDNDQRRIELESGEAYFEVARHPPRPFVVYAGKRKVTALGTKFFVRFESLGTSVALIEGRVSVMPVESGSDWQVPAMDEIGNHGMNHGCGSSSRGGREREFGQAVEQGIVLRPGERLTLPVAGTASLDCPSREAVTAWLRGEIVLDETPLREAVAELNRYQSQQLVLGSTAIGALPISGIFRTGDSQDFARAVALAYDLEVRSDPREIRLLPGK